MIVTYMKNYDTKACESWALKKVLDVNLILEIIVSKHKNLS